MVSSAFQFSVFCRGDKFLPKLSSSEIAKDWWIGEKRDGVKSGEEGRERRYW